MKVITINADDITADKLAEALGLPPGSDEVKEAVAKLREVKARALEQGTFTFTATSMAGYLEESLRVVKMAMTEVLDEADREKREEMAHGLLHLAIDRLSDMIDKLLIQMPCQRDEDEMPSDCTRH